MEDEYYKEFIRKSKDYYKNIGYIECPAFNNERIYLTNRGFNHLIKKDRKYRSKVEQIRRLVLIPYIVDILKNNSNYNTYRITNRENSIASFWSFKKKIDNRIIIVVVCQINKEPKIFISVMDKN